MPSETSNCITNYKYVSGLQRRLAGLKNVIKTTTLSGPMEPSGTWGGTRQAGA